MLKVLLLRKKIDLKKKELEKLRESMTDIEKREADLAVAIDEVKTEEEQASIQEDVDAVVADKGNLRKSIEDVERSIDEMETEMAEAEKAQETEPEKRSAVPANEERSEEPMKKNTTEMSRRDRLNEIVVRDDMKAMLAEVRSAISEKRAISGAKLTIPVVMLELIRTEVARESKLLPYVRRRIVGGTARQNISGAIPEAVWTEMCANINELSLAFNQVEVDGYKVAGYMAICNAVLEDSDLDLADEIVRAIGGAIGKALDKAILFGTGTKMPIGIVTRLAQTAQPSGWGTNAPDWTDLHSTNIQKVDIKSSTGAAFFAALAEKLAIAKPKGSSEGLFWVMNRKTHMDIKAKALAFNSAAALVSNTELFPVVGGTVIEFEDDQISDYEIIGGFGGSYLLAERAGVQFASSDIPLFLADQTVFKATGRYDGMPVFGEAFVVVNYNNTDPTTTKTFPEDYANAAMNDLIITAAAGGTTGKTVLTVSGTIAQSNPVLKYKLGDYSFAVGDALPTGFETLTSGSTAITAASGKNITVVELDANNRIVSEGVVVSVPKT